MILSNNKLVNKILHFGDYQIFEKVSTYTCLLFLKNMINKLISVSKVDSHCFNPEKINNVKFMNIDSNSWTENNWIIIPKNNYSLIEKIKKNKKLSDITSNIFQGPKSGADNVFILKMITKNKEKSVLYSKSLEKSVEIENGILKQYIKGKYIKKYNIDYTANEYAIFPYDDCGQLISIDYIKNIYPQTYKYLNLKENKSILLKRENGKWSKKWWCYSRPQNMKIIFEKKILTPFNAFHNSFGLDIKCDFIFSAGVSGAYGILLKDNIDYKLLISILNSSIIELYIKNISTCLRGGFYSYENKYIKDIPIPNINLSNPSEKQAHDTLVSLVDSMLETQKKLHSSKTESDKKLYQKKADIIDKQIDEIVYKLYDLTDKEIEIIENSLK